MLLHRGQEDRHLAPDLGKTLAAAPEAGCRGVAPGPMEGRRKGIRTAAINLSIGLRKTSEHYTCAAAWMMSGFFHTSPIVFHVRTINCRAASTNGVAMESA